MTWQAEGALLGFWRRAVLRRPPLRLFLDCFFPTLAVLPWAGEAKLPWGSALCCAQLCSADVVYPFECCTFSICMITSSLGSQEKNANTENKVRAVIAVSWFWYSLPFPSCWCSTESVLVWKALCQPSMWCLFFPLPFGWCILEVELCEIGFKRIFVNFRQMSLGALTHCSVCQFSLSNFKNKAMLVKVRKIWIDYVFLIFK